jgi:hypothetical protein
MMGMCVEMSKLCEYGARLLCAKLSVHTLRARPAANAFDLALKIQSYMLLLQVQVQAHSISSFSLCAECSLLLML